MDHVEHTVGESRFLEKLRQPDRGERRSLRGLEDERVPADQGQRDHPERDHVREVEWGDAGHDADGESNELLVDAVGDLVERLPHEEAGRPAGQLDHLDAPPNLALRLGQRLAVLPGHELGELLEVVLEDLLEAEHDRRAVGDGGVRPGRECIRGRSHRSVDLLGGGVGEDGDGFPGGRVEDGLGRTVLRAVGDPRATDETAYSNGAHRHHDTAFASSGGRWC